jgi:outer membrane beta-barrel protein
MTTKLTPFLVGAALVALSSAGVAHAERRLNSLKDDPAVRHRKLLVKGRFEVAPLFESTVNGEFQHIIGGGLKLEYHLTDMFSFGGVVVGSTALKTKLTNRIVDPDSGIEATPDDATREPSRAEFLDRLNTIPVKGAAYVSLTPWYGKLAAFSQAFVAFDFYFQAGVSFAQLKNKWDYANCTPSTMPTRDAPCTDPAPGQPSTERPGTMNGEAAPADNNPNNDDPDNSGSRVGLYLGGGIHVFLSDFLALDLTVRDYAFSDNPSGADYNADLFVGKNPNTGDDDNRFLHHLFFGVGVSIMLPTTVKRTP